MGNEKDKDDLLNYAWTIICNAGGGDWEKETEEWRYAARKFRGLYLDDIKDDRPAPAVCSESAERIAQQKGAS